MKTIKTLSGRALGIAAIAALAALSNADPISVRVNGQMVQFDGTTPHMMGGQVIVPIRNIVEAAGGTVDWNPADKTVTAQEAGIKIEVQVQSQTVKVNDAERSANGPIHIENGWTMVPARLLADCLGATVEYDDQTSVLSLITNGTTSEVTPSTSDLTPSTTNVTPVPEATNTPPPPDMTYQPVGSALKAKLDTQLSSSSSYVGQAFTATIDTGGSSDYNGLPDGTTVKGHVTFVQAMQDGIPGVLGITFDQINLTDGRTQSISASPIDADADIQTGDDGRWIATPDGKLRSDLMFVGNGTTSGVLVSLQPDGSSVTQEQINMALPDRGEPTEVVLDSGTLLGIRVDR